MPTKLKSQNNIADRIVPISEATNNVTALVYGKSGTGKTEFGSTFPTPILHIDIKEKGTDTIMGKSGIKTVRLENWQDAEDVYWYLHDERPSFQSIILDQCTGLQYLGMDDIRKKKKKSNTELFTRQMWGQLSGALKTHLEQYKDLSEYYNICFLAHERAFDSGSDEDEEVLDPNIGARMMPSVGSFLAGACDVIGQTFIREEYQKDDKGKDKRVVQYCMKLGPHAFYTTKIRRPRVFGPPPDYIVDPSYQKLRDVMSGKDSVKKRPIRRK